VTIRARGGDVLASFTTPLPIPQTDPARRPAWTTKSDAELTVEEKYLKAQKHDLATNRKRARESYERVLADDPGYTPALRALAILDTEAALYENAIGRLRKAVDRDPGDGLAWYFLGVNHLRTGNAREALRCARQAMLCPGAGALAFDLAGRAHMVLGEKRPAIEAFSKAIRLNPNDGIARDHWLLALYAAGDTASAFKHAREAVARHPTDLTPRAILALQGRREMDAFVRQVRGFLGEHDFQMLETTLAFAQLGLAAEAAKILSAVCVDAVPAGERSPLPMYYLAWLEKDAAAKRAWLKQAAETYRDFVFPSRPEELEVLGHALQQNPQDACAYLHIGNLYAHLGRPAEAVGHWRKAAELNGSLSVAWRNLGLYAWAAQDDLAKAEECYKKAIEARPRDQTLYRDLAEILTAQGKRPEAIQLLEATPPDRLRRADVIILLAQAYLAEQRYDDTIALLESTPYFVNWEGQTITWDLFHRAHMHRGRIRFDQNDFAQALKDFETALTYPENIGVGRSHRPREATAQYWRGRALQSLGRLDEAKAAWREGSAGVEGSGEQSKYRRLCAEALQGQG
jgi:tetratricopeptide (TPR) repeat protein